MKMVLCVVLIHEHPHHKRDSNGVCISFTSLKFCVIGIVTVNVKFQSALSVLNLLQVGNNSAIFFTAEALFKRVCRHMLAAHHVYLGVPR